MEIAKNIVGWTATAIGLGCTAVGLFLTWPISEARTEVAELESHRPSPPEDLEQLPEHRKLDTYQSFSDRLSDHLDEITLAQAELTSLTDGRFNAFTIAVTAGIISFGALSSRRQPEDPASPD